MLSNIHAQLVSKVSKAVKPSSGLVSRVVGERACLSTTVNANQDVSQSSGTVNASKNKQQWSGMLSYSSPESDFTASAIIGDAKVHANDHLQQKSDTMEHKEQWSGMFSFSSPESDFTASSINDNDKMTIPVEEKEQWSNTLSYSSPESDFTASNLFDERVILMDHLKNNPQEQNNMAYSFSFAQADGDLCSPPFVTMLDDRMKRQLQNVTDAREKQLKTLAQQDELHGDAISSVMKNQDVLHNSPLPSNMVDLVDIANDPRAIVVTEAAVPFRIVTVNNAWENLCGYSASECRGETLECIQGEETDKAAVTALMSQLLKGEEAGTVLTNYTKQGDKFHNRLRVGPLVNDHDQITHFVGILQKIGEDNESFVRGGGKRINSIA